MIGTRLAGLALVSLLMAGCGAGKVPLDDRTEGDGVRDQAMGLFVGRSVTDRVDGTQGDNTDWKYVDTIDPGLLRLELSFDSPERLVEAEIELLDEFGSRMDRRLISPTKTSYVFAQEVKNVPAKFYVRVFSRTGASVYSIGVRQSIAARPKPKKKPKVVVRVVKTTNTKTNQSRKRRRTTRKRTTKTKGRTGSKTTKTTKVVTTKKAPDPPPPPASGASPIKGTVIRIIPADDNNSVTLTVSLKGGARVPKGATGTVFKNGVSLGKMRVSSVKGKLVTGVLRVRAGKAKGLMRVVFPPN